MRRAGALTALLVTVGAVAALRADALPRNPWTGTWRSGSVEFTLTQSGSSITGTSPCDNYPNGITNKGTITSADGSKAHFTYSGGTVCPGAGGQYDAVMASDARSVDVTGVTQYGTPFHGTWFYVRGGTEPRVAPAVRKATYHFTIDARNRVKSHTFGSGTLVQTTTDTGGSTNEKWSGRGTLRHVDDYFTAEQEERLTLRVVGGSGDVAFRLQVLVTASNHRECPVGTRGTLTFAEGDGPDRAELRVCGNEHHHRYVHSARYPVRVTVDRSP